jgi:hypothetical protein
MITTALIAIPVMSIDRATLGSASLFTSQAIRPPTHPMRIGRSHHAPLTRRFRATGGAQTLGDEGVERALDAAPMPTSALCGSDAENDSHADRHPSSVLGYRETGA